MAGIDDAFVALFSKVLAGAGVTATTIVAPLHVTDLARLSPELIVCDVDRVAVDPLETLRQIRFVLPKCIIAVYTHVHTASWALSCHLAGANSMLSKQSTERELAIGIRGGISSGCFTDARFDAA